MLALEVRIVGTNLQHQEKKSSLISKHINRSRSCPPCCVCVYTHEHRDMSVVRLAFVHLHGVLLTGKLSGAAQ